MGFIVPAVGRTLAQKRLLGTASGTTCRQPSYIGSGTDDTAVSDSDTKLGSEYYAGTPATTRAESVNTEPSATIHQGSGTVTYNVPAGSITLYEAGWFTSTTSTEDENTLYCRGTLSSPVVVTDGDKVTWTFQVQYNQG